MSVSALERWYASQCDGSWEQSYGIRIDTLDNPGWRIQIDLRDTRKQDSALGTRRLDRTENDWIQYWTEKQKFNIACGPLNLSEAGEIFVRWFEADLAR